MSEEFLVDRVGLNLASLFRSRRCLDEKQVHCQMSGSKVGPLGFFFLRWTNFVFLHFCSHPFLGIVSLSTY